MGCASALLAWLAGRLRDPFRPAGPVALVAGLLCAPGSATLAQEPPATFSGVAAVGVSLSDESAAIPVLRLDFNGPLVLGDSPACRVDVTLQLSGLPGESIDLQEPTTWKAAEVFGELQRRVGSDRAGASTYVVLRGGFHTRILPSDQTPRERYARSYGAGVRLEHRAAGSIRRSIALLYGRSDVVSPQFDYGQLMVEGHAKVASIAGASLVIGGDAYLSVSRTPAQGARDVLRLWVGAGW